MIEFNLPSMSCGHCVATVSQALKQADPEAEVDVDLASHRVQVESTLPRQDLAAALTAAGYAPA